MDFCRYLHALQYTIPEINRKTRYYHLRVFVKKSGFLVAEYISLGQIYSSDKFIFVTYYISAHELCEKNIENTITYCFLISWMYQELDEIRPFHLIHFPQKW